MDLVLDAVTVVADAEQQDLRAQIANLRTMYAASEARVSDLIDERDQLLETRTDRRAVLREAADRIDNEELPPDYVDMFDNGARWAAKLLRRVADETAATETQPTDLPALAAALDGFATLLATSSRDWGVYRVDAWLYAVICGWDCEQTEHDATCTHGALEEMAELHGWDDATVAKARRYRAAVRALVETHQPAVEQPFVPPAHYRRDDDVDCCVHAIPVGPDSCRACRELADAEAAAGARQDGEA
ncbi:hypothetical protein STENM36S_05047 [Streptomyces tendae]